MTDDTISPLRRRMSEDMTVRGFTACTQRGYIAAVRRFTVFLGRSPDQATAEDLRRFQLQMRVEGASATTMNAAVSAVRFFFGVTLGRGDAEVGLTTVREPRRLPVVLSPQEVTRLLGAGLKYRAALSPILRCRAQGLGDRGSAGSAQRRVGPRSCVSFRNTRRPKVPSFATPSHRRPPYATRARPTEPIQP
jgi:integrase